MPRLVDTTIRVLSQEPLAGLMPTGLRSGGALLGGDSHALSVGEQPERWLGTALRFDEGNGAIALKSRWPQVAYVDLTPVAAVRPRRIPATAA